MTQLNLRALAQQFAEGTNNLATTIEKELLHYEILHIMNSKGYLSRLTFQGGTSLRLCYGSERLSEDLDFTGGMSFKGEQMAQLKDELESALSSKYGTQVTVKAPKQVESNEGIQVSAWQVKVETAPGQTDIPRQMIKIEVANIPSYTSETRLVVNNYPENLIDPPLVNVQTMEEIMADKILAFPADAQIRYRDIWDLTWMATRQAVRPNIVMVKNKVADYSAQDYVAKLEDRIENLHEIIESNAFQQQMSRFLKMSTIESTVANPSFRAGMESTVRDLLTTCLREFN